MARDIDFINDERKSWGKVYTDITYAISEVSQFLDEDELRSRRYFTKLNILDEYMDMLNDKELDSKKKSFFNAFKSDDRIENLRAFKLKNSSTFKKLENCSKCQCLNCMFECEFKKCSSCRDGSLIKFCDKEKANVRTYEMFTQDLVDNDTQRTDKYKVLATVEDCELETLYILLENLCDESDKLILNYYPGLKKDSFGEITDIEEFNFVVETYQQSDY